ncbi:SDR family NAD(P)-dependent oxidoreductase [Streptomyces clavuligerus]|uniref:Glucose 1-dehydrogenase 2 n=1 Tax=Streptomyces clavuligerus TaxID=1901 RepID=B5GMI1_STRCL|nr:oxidoreductase [Streptomyces clavuligerus]ANW22390.1 3-oxoacyl-ACP reductase [Streptomyces clavuligerus]AXU17295.1 SDR family oxidoreductase [Streptomyces clavuligerus]EDY47527.1 dehydrogenase [Streptomyces clavuligerus]EFG04489.1 Glucose 1-dehydrogenase 2 [Streptomyces clavuligerus]MBY6307058.1 SDR family oxidoreductase [Streptomyces clavuligerus]
MDLRLKDKVAVVTGGSKGIGLAVAEAFGREGARVVVGSRTGTPGLAALRERYDTVFVPVDLAAADGADRLIGAAADRHGRVDVLVNNLGVTSPRSGFLDIDDDAWERVFGLTFFSAVRASRAALPHLLAGGAGAIVNITSVNARLPFPMVVDYSAAKAALSNLTKALSEEFAPRGVRVNAIAPGPVRTPFWTDPGGFADAVASEAGGTAEAALDEVVPRTMGISTGRITEPGEVADLAVFLASPNAGNITGAEFIIDGGQIKTL